MIGSRRRSGSSDFKSAWSKWKSGCLNLERGKHNGGSKGFAERA
jgi:hypothetical protein